MRSGKSFVFLSNFRKMYRESRKSKVDYFGTFLIRVKRPKFAKFWKEVEYFGIIFGQIYAIFGQILAIFTVDFQQIPSIFKNSIVPTVSGTVAYFLVIFCWFRTLVNISKVVKIDPKGNFV